MKRLLLSTLILISSIIHCYGQCYTRIDQISNTTIYSDSLVFIADNTFAFVISEPGSRFTTRIPVTCRNIVIYPNPTNDEITVLNIDKTLNNIGMIFDISGHRIKSVYVNQTIDVSELSNGMYFIHIDGTMYKFVKY